MWCQIFTDLKSISWISSKKCRVKTYPCRVKMYPLGVSERKIRPAVSELPLMSRVWSASAFLISIFLCEYEKSALFSWSYRYPGVLSKWHFSLCPSECMLYECVTMNKSLYLYLKKKKITAQGYQKPSKGLAQLNSVCNQFDLALTSMYTKVLTGWDETKTLYQMLAKEHVAVFSTSCYHFNVHHLSPSGLFPQCFSCEKSEEAPLLLMRFAWLYGRFQIISLSFCKHYI